MLELVEIFDGFFLLLVYLTLTLFVPVAFIGVAAGIGAALAGRLLGALARPLRLGPESDFTRPKRAARLLLVVVPSWAIGVAALLAAIAFLGGRLSPDPVGTLAEGARLLVAVLAKIQDASMLAWTGRDLASVLAQTGASDGLRPLGGFTALVAERVFELMNPELSLEVFRWVFALSIGAIVLAAGGLSPLRLLDVLYWRMRRRTFG